MYSDPGAWNALMERLTDATALYLNAQVGAGAQALQVFDSWVGTLSPHDYRRFVQPHMARLFAAARSVGAGDPLRNRHRHASGASARRRRLGHRARLARRARRWLAAAGS